MIPIEFIEHWNTYQLYAEKMERRWMRCRPPAALEKARATHWALAVNVGAAIHARADAVYHAIATDWVEFAATWSSLPMDLREVIDCGSARKKRPTLMVYAMHWMQSFGKNMVPTDVLRYLARNKAFALTELPYQVDVVMPTGHRAYALDAEIVENMV